MAERKAKHNVIRGVIFDLDGLLLDSEIYWEEARRNYCRQQNCNWRHDQELSAKGRNSREWAALIRRHCQFDSDIAEIIDGVVDEMRKLYEKRLPLLDGATETVRELAARYPLALASSSPRSLIGYTLEAAGLQTCFRITVSSDEAGKGKPSPDVFLLAAERLGIPPEGLVVFEDSKAGILAAKSAHMRVIAVPNEHYPPDEESLQKADLVLGSLVDFKPEMLSRL